jgi:cytochrome c553
MKICFNTVLYWYRYIKSCNFAKLIFKALKTIKIVALVGLLIVGFFTWFLVRSSAERGEKLAKTHCASCHQFPDPSILPKSVWEQKLLPEMKKRMGLGDMDEMLKKLSYQDLTYFSDKGIYPMNPAVSEKDWEKIVAYYVNNAPENPLPQKEKQQNTLIEQTEITEIKGENLPKTGTTYFGVDQGKIYLSNVQGKLSIEDLQTGKKQQMQLPSAMVQIHGDLVLCVGGDMNPTEAHTGGLFKLNSKSSTGIEPILTNLHRPVDFAFEDFNNDGVKDYLIAEFGFETGEIAYFDGKTKNKNTLSPLPGARNFVLRDVNKDGLLDFYVLMAQARERVSLFKNKGNGQFEEIEQINLPSYYGTSSLEMADLNNDGKEEIILPMGDNADYSYCKKNYHGVRIYQQTVINHWKEIKFFPIFGATTVLASDLNKDGLPDLVASANFVEEEFRDSETVIYFINKGKMQFDIKHLKVPKINPLTMSIGEVNGQKELFLGNWQFTSMPLKGIRVPLKYP